MRRILTFAIAMLAIALPASSQEGPGIDPKAIEIATGSSDYLASQPEISVGWFITYDALEDGREKRTIVWAGDSVIIREKGYRSSSVQGNEARDYLFDGTTFTAVFAGEAQYGSISVPGNFANLNTILLDRYGMELPLAEMFDQSGSGEGLAAASEAVYVGEVFFGDTTAHHLAFRRYEGDWEMWISTDPENPVPLMIAGSNPYQHGWPKFQAVFYDWNFTPDVPEGVFDFDPPEGFDEIELPAIKETAQ